MRRWPFSNNSIDWIIYITNNQMKCAKGKRVGTSSTQQTCAFKIKWELLIEHSMFWLVENKRTTFSDLLELDTGESLAIRSIRWQSADGAVETRELIESKDSGAVLK